MRQRPLDRRGFLITDCIVAFGIIALVALTLAWTRGQQVRSSRRLAEHRQAVRLAEDALFHLRAARALPAAPDGWTLSAAPLPRADPPAAPGHVFVRVSVQTPQTSASLIGLAPRAAAEGLGQNGDRR